MTTATAPTAIPTISPVSSLEDEVALGPAEVVPEAASSSSSPLETPEDDDDDSLAVGSERPELAFCVCDVGIALAGRVTKVDVPTGMTHLD